MTDQISEIKGKKHSAAWHRCVEKMNTDGKYNAYAVCTASLKKTGNLWEGDLQEGAEPLKEKLTFLLSDLEVEEDGVDVAQVLKDGGFIGLSVDPETFDIEEISPEVEGGLASEHYHGSETAMMPTIPSGTTSFVDLDLSRQAQKMNYDIEETLKQYQQLSQNILWSSEVSNKGEALLALTNELIGRLPKSAPEVEESGAEEEQPEKIVESFGGVDILEVVSEAQPSSSLIMKVIPIRPGWGNTRDNHFYSPEMLRENAKKFVGAKMYETDHKAGEKSTRTWVSTVTSVDEFTDEGAPIARVAVHDPGFAERARNLKELGLLEKLECSILAGAVAEKQPFTQNGRKGRRIREITDVESIDWVTKAGAGGHALEVSESEPEGATPAEGVASEEVVVMLDKVLVQEIINESSLPEPAKVRLAEVEYEDEEAVQAAVAKEIEYLKSVTGSGKPFGQGTSESPETEETHLGEAEYDEAYAEITTRYGLTQ
jgi:hypothetical protein